jgi:hypothetical protein
VQEAHCLEHLQLIDNINFVSATLCCYQGHEARAYIEIESFLEQNLSALAFLFVDL